MALKVYRARSMQDALAEVKRDLGVDAVILNTKSYKSGGLLGFGARPIVEITATNDENPPTRRPRTHERARPAEPIAPVRPAPAFLRAYAQSERPAQQATLPAPIQAQLLGAVPAPVAQVPTAAAAHVPAQRIMTVASTRSSPPVPSRDDDLQSIKRMLARLVQSAAPAGAMSDPLFAHYLALQEQAVAVEIADEIVGRVRDELSPAELADDEIVRETMLRHIAALIPAYAEQPRAGRPADGRPLTVALIGPTGVGKTTTLAKLAAVAKLRHGRRVGLITTDTYRIAAVEQLRTYADIIGIPLRVVAAPSEMREAIASMADADQILIDTAGRSQHDRPRLAELRAYLDEADPHETHLVLSGVASRSVLERAADNFTPLRPNRLIVTKLDEAVDFGVLLGVIRRVGVSMSYVTTGQEVPDHIEPCRPERLARLILTGSLPA